MLDWFPALGPLALAAIGLIPDAAANPRPRAVARYAWEPNLRLLDTLLLGGAGAQTIAAEAA